MEFRVVSKEEQDEQDELDEINLSKPNYDEANPPKHTGLFFRGFNSVYWTGTELAQKQGYRLLKRRSCKGCPTCDAIDEMMPDWASDTMELNDIKHGGLYRLDMRVIEGPYEYPNDIDVELEITEIKE